MSAVWGKINSERIAQRREEVKWWPGTESIGGAQLSRRSGVDTGFSVLCRQFISCRFIMLAISIGSRRIKAHSYAGLDHAKSTRWIAHERLEVYNRSRIKEVNI